MTPDYTGEPRSAGHHLTPRAAFWCALSIWVLTLATAGTGLIYSHVYPLPPAARAGTGSGADGVVAMVFIVGFATVGALLIWKRSANPIGWLMSATAASYALAAGVGLLLLHFPQTRAWGNWVGWLFGFGIGFVVFVLLLFPTGSLPSRRAVRRLPQPHRCVRAGREHLQRLDPGRHTADLGDRAGRHRLTGIPLPAGPGDRA
jgi:hypothetical protein